MKKVPASEAEPLGPEIESTFHLLLQRHLSYLTHFISPVLVTKTTPARPILEVSTGRGKKESLDYLPISALHYILNLLIHSNQPYPNTQASLLPHHPGLSLVLHSHPIQGRESIASSLSPGPTA